MDVISMSINSQILPTQKMQMLSEVKKNLFDVTLKTVPVVHASPAYN